MKQGHLINKINKLIPVANAVPLSEFYDNDTYKGIWFKGSGNIYKDQLIFESCGYDDYIHPELEKILDDAGWYWEPYDCGTLLAYSN